VQSPKLNDVSLGFTGVLDINKPEGFTNGTKGLTFSLSTRHMEEWTSEFVQPCARMLTAAGCGR